MKNYNVKVKCTNCHQVDNVEVEFGKELEESNMGSGLYVNVGTYKDEWIKCKNCGTNNLKKVY